MFCSSCGKQVPEHVPFCANCGAPTSGSSAAVHRQRRNPLVVALLIVIALMVVIAGVVVFTIGSVAVPKMQRAVRQAAEVSAVQQIRTIQAAQTQYFSQFGRYAASLAELGPPAGGGAGPAGADLIPADVASGVKGGYRFTLQGTASGYQLHAVPITQGKTGYARSTRTNPLQSIKTSDPLQPRLRAQTSRNSGVDFPRLGILRRMTAKHMLVLLFYCIAAWGQPQRSSLDYPLGLKTRWTYHLHHENGPGVHFGDTLAALAKDNVLDTTLISEAVGLDTVGAHSYTRVETRLNGKPWLFEWQRLSPEGLMIGKTIDYQQGDQAVIMQPEQKRISAELRPGNSWSWTAKDAPVRFRYAVAGPGQVDVPASHYQGINLNTNGTVDAPFGKVEIHQDTWFVPGVGIVRQETTTNVGERKLSHVVLTLEKFEHP